MDTTEYQVAILIGIGSVGMLLLVGAIILFMVFYQKKMIQEQVKRQQLELNYQQKMLEATLHSQEDERKRLAADLHDSVGGMLSAIRMGVAAVSRLLPDQKGADDIKKMLDDTIGSVRSISSDLMPATLDKFGLAQAVKEMCEKLSATTTIPVLFHEVGEFPDMEKNKELMAFRVIQESLNNAIKHSQASELNVSLISADQLLILIEDNGKGFDIESKQKNKEGRGGLGLYSIENRARLLHAKIEFNSVIGKGTKITMAVPRA